MPRKSAAEIAMEGFVPAVPAAHERPPPPEGMVSAAAGIWCDVVASMRPGWFSRETHEQLARYCNAMVECRRLEVVLAGLGVRAADYERLSKQLNTTAGRALGFAKALRIAPSTNRENMSKIDARDARRSLRPKPWEDDITPLRPPVVDSDPVNCASETHPRPWED